MMAASSPFGSLQDISTKRNQQIDYAYLDQQEPATVFTCRVDVGDYTVAGQGASRKRAKHAAAKNAYNLLTHKLEGGPAVPHENLSCSTSRSDIHDLPVEKYVSKLEALAKRLSLKTPIYEEASKQSPQKEFVCSATLGDSKATGTGSSRKNAKRDAASNLLETIQKSKDRQQDLRKPTQKNAESNVLEKPQKPGSRKHENSRESGFEDQINRDEKEMQRPAYESRFEADFNVIRCLGQGGYGVVFVATHKRDGQGYAVKRIDIPGSDMSEEKVMKEVGALARLDHPHIVRYHSTWVETPPAAWQREKDKSYSIGSSHSAPVPLGDKEESTQEEESSSGGVVFAEEEGAVGGVIHKEEVNRKLTISDDAYSEDDKEDEEDFSQASNAPTKHFLYIQMQLCASTLKDWLGLEAPCMDRRAKLNTFYEVVSAVAYVHKEGLIHRDIKPSNIFLSENRKIKLGDFGLVTEHSKDPDTTSKSSTSKSSIEHSMGCGSALYMSPEQSDRKDYGQKVDIFPLGLIFLELWIPFGSESERIKTLMNAREGMLPDEFTENLPEESKLASRMTCQNPIWRPLASEICDHPMLKEVSRNHSN